MARFSLVTEGMNATRTEKETPMKTCPTHPTVTLSQDPVGGPFCASCEAEQE